MFSFFYSLLWFENEAPTFQSDLKNKTYNIGFLKCCFGFSVMSLRETAKNTSNGVCSTCARAHANRRRLFTRT